MSIFSGSSKTKLFLGSTKIKKVYKGTEKVYSAGNIVTYIVDSGTSYQEEVDEGVSCLSLTTFTPAKSGWTFVGWREDTTASSSVLNSKVMGDEPIALYAVFKQDISITFYNNQTTAEYQWRTRYYNNGNVLNGTFENLYTRERSGWVTYGWGTDAGAGATAVYSNGVTVTLDRSITLYALYYKDITITYFNNTTTATYAYGRCHYNSSGAQSNPSFTLWQVDRSGWAGYGWSYDSHGGAGAIYGNGAAFTRDTSCTLYGVYYRDCYVNCVSCNNWNVQQVWGRAHYNSSGAVANAVVTMPNGVGIAGWAWRGWSNLNDDTANGGVLTHNGWNLDIGTGDFTVYGLYEQTAYVYFNGNGATGGSTATLTGIRYYCSAGNIIHPTFALPVNGFIHSLLFKYWIIDNVAYNPGSNITPTYDCTAYAQWASSTVAVFDSGNYCDNDTTSEVLGGWSSVEDYYATISNNQLVFRRACTVTFSFNMQMYNENAYYDPKLRAYQDSSLLYGCSGYSLQGLSSIHAKTFTISCVAGTVLYFHGGETASSSWVRAWGTVTIA